MSVRVELSEPGVEGIAVPETALFLNEEGHHVVTVVKDGKAVPTEIEIDSDNEPEIRADNDAATCPADTVLQGLVTGRVFQ